MSGNRRREFLCFEKEEQIKFISAVKAYRSGIKHIYVGNNAGGSSRPKDIRFFLVKRGCLIIVNLLKGRIQLLFNTARNTIKEIDVYKIRPLLFRKVVFRHLEKKYQKAVDTFVRNAAVPVLAVSDFENNKALMFITSLGPGGSERQCANAAAGLAKTWEVSVVCEHYETVTDRHFGSHLDNNGIPIAQLGAVEESCSVIRSYPDQRLATLLNDDFFDPDSYFGRSLIPYIAEIIRFKPHVVHAWLDYTNVRAGLAALIAGVPRIILSLRSMAPDNFSFYTIEMKPVYQAMLASGRVIIVNNSHAGRLDYCRWLRARQVDINVVYNGISPPAKLPDPGTRAVFRDQHGIPVNSPVIGGVFRISEEKRPLFWLDHARILLKSCPSAYFVLVGDGKLMNAARMYSKKLGMEHRVKFTGNISMTQEAIISMDVIVLTSRIEGTPNVLLEAQYMGVPVVTTDAGGASEAVLDGITGHVVTKATPGKVANKVFEILNDSAWTTRASAECSAFIKGKFDTTTMINKYNEMYI